jgi:hypothetical protein
MSSKKFIVGFIIFAIIVVVFAGVSAWWLRGRQQVAEQNKANTPTDKPYAIKSDVAFTKLPQKFPADIPLEAGALVTQNYNATTPDGQFQATRMFVTAKSLDENLAIYTAYFKKAGWDVKSTVNQPAIKMLYGVKGKMRLQFETAEVPATKQRTVTISYTELP